MVKILNFILDRFYHNKTHTVCVCVCILDKLNMVIASISKPIKYLEGHASFVGLYKDSIDYVYNPSSLSQSGYLFYGNP